MGCCGDREKQSVMRAEQKWDYINLDDFKTTSCLTPLSYGILYISLFISVAVYAVDTFTAINLVVFDRWSGQIKPVIPLRISRWIFVGCILLSFVLLFYRWWRAIRVIKRAGVAESYLDPLAVRLQSVRTGKEGRGWKRFLVFADLTTSKKGADYVALFTYFSFEAWLRIVFAEGPRQVVNALTLYSVMRLNLIPEGDHRATDGHTPIVQFFVNVGVLAGSNKEQAVILFGMLFTLIIWVISAISLIVAVVLYLLFLFHHIPSADGGLSGYCRRKINGRAEKIVLVKVNKALRKENALRARREAREGRPTQRQPTLPSLHNNSDDDFPALSPQATLATLPDYSSRPGTPVGNLDRQPALPNLNFSEGPRPEPPSRLATDVSASSWTSYGSNAPLIAEASSFGHGPPGRAESPAYDSPSIPSRSMTGVSQSTQRNFSPLSGSGQDRRPPAAYQMEPVSRPGTAGSTGTRGSAGRRTPGPGPSPVEGSGRRTPAVPSTSHLQYIPGMSGRTSPDPPPPYTSGAPPSVRSMTPGASSTTRSQTPQAPPSTRSRTPNGAYQPALHRINTSDEMGTNSTYRAYSPDSSRSATPSSARTAASAAYQSLATNYEPIPVMPQFAYAPTRSDSAPPRSAQARYAPPRSGTAPPR